MSAVRMFIPEERMKLMQGIQQANSTHNCPDCKRPTYCAMEDGKSASLCWCMTVTKATNVSSDPDTCLCRDCLTGQEL